MSFNKTKSPTKPTCKPKYILPKKSSGKIYLTPELEAEFRRLFPVTMNRRMMQLFGLSFGTLQRLKRDLGLKKDNPTIWHKLAQQTKRKLEKNGYYDSLRGKSPSQATIDATRKRWAEGFHPLKALKEKDPLKYKAAMRKKRKQRLALEKKERRNVRLGLSQQTNLHRPQFTFTRRQLSHRYSALNRGYILGDMHDMSGERYTIFYDSKTTRSTRFERNLIADGFTIEPLTK